MGHTRCLKDFNLLPCRNKEELRVWRKPESRHWSFKIEVRYHYLLYEIYYQSKSVNINCNKRPAIGAEFNPSNI